MYRLIPPKTNAAITDRNEWNNRITSLRCGYCVQVKELTAKIFYTTIFTFSNRPFAWLLPHINSKNNAPPGIKYCYNNSKKREGRLAILCSVVFWGE
jgi:hypothetical protein